MKNTLIVIIILSIFIGGFSCSGTALNSTQSKDPNAFHKWADSPPMGWNSWDCFGAGVTEQDALANAEYMEKNLKSHGWSIVTIDIQWYEPLAHTDQYRRFAALEMDEYGRLLPAPNRFPSTKETRSFKPIADKIHAMGLKLGVHLMRGIPRQAVDQNVPILGTDVHAADIANTRSTCAWNTDMYGVDMTKPGAQEYYDSVFALLASWEVDLVKVDDLSAPSYNQPEVEAIRKAIDKTGRPIILSTSPGATPLSAGEHVQEHANMWRISNDFWDTWSGLYAQFKRLDDWTPYRGPGHFPDADMLPIGNLRTWQENNSWTRFTEDEQITLMTLWSIARSPLIIGGHMPNNDEFTLSLLTNDELIEVNQNSTNNKQLFNQENHIVWVADVPDSEDKYVAFFNARPAPAPRGRGRRGGFGSQRGATPTVVDPSEMEPAEISISLSDLEISGQCKVRDLWEHNDLGTVSEKITATVNSHGAVLYRITP
ncbi:MAG: glycoside hydrolase family 27 protein [Sedimentisphaerales bacterium]|nr:glycoside hydrolase family 27 protein [Sedimentisphaerales bacterium]